MTKRTKVFVGFLLIIILFLIFVLSKNSKQNPPEMINKEQSSEIEVQPTVVNGKGSLDELMKRNENLECAISYKNATSSEVVEGTYFTSNGKMRGDFLTEDSGQKILSSMIIKDGIFYSWSTINNQKFGMKANLEQLTPSGSDSSQPKADNGPVSLDQSVNYDCKPWNSVDGSVFEPPTDIVFSEFGNVMNTGMEYGDIYNTDGVEVEKMIKDLEKEINKP